MSESAQNRYFRKQLEKRLGKSIIGIGQVVSEEFEVAQRQQGKFTSYKEQASGVLLNKYKVRICSATNDTERVDDLIDAYGQSPTSGLRGEACPTPAYPVNTYVTIFQDPLTQLYYIEHAHINTKADLPKTKEFAGCGAASGFIPGSINFKVPQSCIDPKGSGVASGSEVPRNTVPSKEDEKQNTHNESIEIRSSCIPVDTAAINKELEGLIKFVEELKNGVLGEDSFLQTSQEFLDQVQSKVNQVSQAIANSITWLIDKIRKYIMRQVNGIVNNTIGNVYLNIRFSILEANDQALNLISCLFLEILNNLANLIADFLNELIDTFLNTGLCVIESFLSSLIGSILPALLDSINSILGPISSLIGETISLANDVISFVESIIDFLSCDVQQLCPVTNEWNFLEGGIDSSQFSLSTLDFNSIFESASSFADSVIALGEIPGDITSSLSGLNAQEIAQSAIDSALDCVGLEECGVPTVSFWGSDGSGTTGDVVVSTAGEILGINIITPGSDYSSEPTVSINDSCGTGTGAYGTAVIGDVNVYTDDGTIVDPDNPDNTREQETVTGVVDVIINNSGYGYLSSPDGSIGGMNRVIADRCQSLIRRGDTNKWEGPFDPGEVIDIRVGDTVRLAGIPEYISQENTSITTPPCPDLVSSTSPSTTYPVAVSIGGVYIQDPGFGFSDGDTITVITNGVGTDITNGVGTDITNGVGTDITNGVGTDVGTGGGTSGNGAELVPVIGGNGRIIDVNIFKPGIGLTNMPTLKLNTSTGYNATLIPILSFKRIDENTAFSIPAGTQLIQVVDCVGKN